jgi:hypothetical protein
MVSSSLLTKHDSWQQPPRLQCQPVHLRLHKNQRSEELQRYESRIGDRWEKRSVREPRGAVPGSVHRLQGSSAVKPGAGC